MYNKQTWITGETLTAAKLNHIEDGLADVDANNGLQGVQLNGELFRYDFLNTTSSGSSYTPNFDTTKLIGGYTNNNLTANGYAPTIGFSNYVKINTYIDIDYLCYRAKVLLTDLTAVLTLGSIDEKGRNFASCVSFDFSTKQILIGKTTVGTSIPNTFVSVDVSDIIHTNDLIYYIEVGRINRELYAKITNFRTCENKKYIVSEANDTLSNVHKVGWLYDVPEFAQASGSQAYFQEVSCFVPTNVKCVFLGDSITQGHGVGTGKCWATLAANEIGNSFNMGRSAGTIVHTQFQVNDILPVVKPKYVVVTIGTNGGNTSQNLAALVESIKALPAIPIINCVSRTTDTSPASINATILNLHELGARMDIATSIDKDLSKAIDLTLFLSDKLHPNDNGYIVMKDRFMCDIGYLIRGNTYEPV